MSDKETAGPTHRGVAGHSFKTRIASGGVIEEYRASQFEDVVDLSTTDEANTPASAFAVAAAAIGLEDTTSMQNHDGAIGDILRVTNNLTDAQVNQIVAYQRRHRVKFGEAALALKLVKSEDVMWALSQQFQYAYTPVNNQKLSDELVVASQPFSDAAELFRDIRSQLLMNVPENGVRQALCVVSPNVGDGKSFFAANLAVAFSQLGGRTLLIDADMRTPRQHEIFSVNATGGLSGILSGRAKANVLRPIDALPSLYFLPVGAVPPNPLELVQRPNFAVLVKGVLNKFDHIIVDTPAAEHGADARLIASRCGAAMLIGRKNRSQITGLQALIAQISKSTERFAGVVMNEF